MASYLGKRNFELRPLMDKLAVIKQQISEFESQKEVAQESARKATAEIDSLRAQISSLTEAIMLSKQEVDSFIEESKKLIFNTVESLKSADDLSSQFIELIKVLERKIEVSTNELEQIKLNKEIAQKDMAIQGKNLSKRMDDLDIYRSRLEKKCKELGIDIIIKL